MGFLSSLGIILWLPVFTLGALTVTAYSALFGYAYLGLGLYVGGNVAVAAYWNEARKHSRSDSFDDRLSTEKMEHARIWWMNKRHGDSEEKN